MGATDYLDHGRRLPRVRVSDILNDLNGNIHIDYIITKCVNVNLPFEDTNQDGSNDEEEEEHD